MRPAESTTLARLHAALDSVVETQQLIADVRRTPGVHPAAVERLTELVGETRELLRHLLRQPAH